MTKQIFRGLFFITLLLPSLSYAKIGLSRYQLTNEEFELIARLEERGISAEVIEDFARKLDAKNRNVSTGPYIPSYTMEDLYAIGDWAEGGAYRTFAKDADVNFDFHAYMADCPNLAVFNFGRATGMEHLPFDILGKFTNTIYYLNSVWTMDPKRFRENYLRIISETEFVKYVIPDAELEMASAIY